MMFLSPPVAVVLLLPPTLAPLSGPVSTNDVCVCVCVCVCTFPQMIDTDDTLLSIGVMIDTDITLLSIGVL